jgi:hypothetical protein
LREFLGINRLNKQTRDLVTTGLLNRFKNTRGEIIEIAKEIGAEKDIIIHYRISIDVIDISGNEGHRYVSGIYHGVLGEMKYLDKPESLSGTIQNNKFIRFYKTKKLGDTMVQNKNKPVEHNSFNGLELAIIEQVEEYVSNFANIVIFQDLSLSDLRTNKLHIKDMKLRLNNSYKVFNIFNETIEVESSDNQCVPTYLQSIYPKIKIFKYFNNHADGVTTSEIIEFCSKYHIKCIAYDVEGNIIAKHIPTNPTKSHRALIYIAYNNHIYPIKNTTLNRKEYDTDKCKIKNKETGEYEIVKYTIETEQSIQRRFNELIKSNIIPGHVNGILEKKSVTITEFVHNDQLYIYNRNYNIIKRIMNVFGLDDKIRPNMSLMSMMYELEHLYGIKETHSFFPELKYHTFTPCRYVNDNHKNINIDSLTTIDKNKMYGYCLYALSYIMTIDIRTCKIIENPTELITNYIYYVEPEKSSILMNNANFYDGFYLQYCEEQGLKFKLIKGYECGLVDNKFKQMIDDYYTKTTSIAKENDEFKDMIKLIINMYIGCFERGCEAVDKINISKICTEDEARCTKNPSKKYSVDNTEIYFCFNDSKFVNIDSRKLISMQIKNMSRRILYEKMQELKLTDKDIVQINTDSITYVNNNIKPSNMNETFKGWKNIEFSEINYEYNEVLNNTLERNTGRNNNELHLGYAGCGKTHTIRNIIVPQLVSKGLTYLILSPNHSAIEEYRKHNMNCNVLQYYDYNISEIPTEDVIIIDEIGLCDGSANNNIYRFHLAGIRIIAYGDYEQLYPVLQPKHFNNDEYINDLYRTKSKCKSNYRNNFSNEYYDSLINETIDCVKEVKKHMTSNYLKADAIVCISNATCDSYNDKVMKALKIEFGDIGFKTICKTNKLRHHNIYNNFVMTVTDKTVTHVKLNDMYSIPINQFNEKNFRPAYARTLYNVQGKTLDSYYVPTNDLKIYENGRRAYTLISRLKSIDTIGHKTVTQQKKDEPVLMRISL